MNYDAIFVPTVVTSCSLKPAGVQVLLKHPEEVLGNVYQVGERNRKGRMWPSVEVEEDGQRVVRWGGKWQHFKRGC